MCICVSRSGTLAVVVAAKVSGLRVASKVVDLIVDMRRSRDGTSHFLTVSP
jgi:hypothetical protein